MVLKNFIIVVIQMLISEKSLAGGDAIIDNKLSLFINHILFN